jgi:hypothetical protein
VTYFRNGRNKPQKLNRFLKGYLEIESECPGGGQAKVLNCLIVHQGIQGNLGIKWRVLINEE